MRRECAPAGYTCADHVFETSIAYAGDSTFMSQLVGYDKDNMSPTVIAAIRPYLDRKEFDPEVRLDFVLGAEGFLRCRSVPADHASHSRAHDRYQKVHAPHTDKSCLQLM